MQNDPLISIRDLHVSFGSVEVLHGIDLDIEQGVIHALIGESGSGKSVLARSILGLAGNNCRINGSIQFQGKELLTLSAEEYRKLRGAEIAMVVQDAMSALNPMGTIGHQLMETIACRHPNYRDHNTATVLATHKHDLHDIALELLKTVGITAPEKRMTSYAHQLSGGMRQRIMIALALVGSPKLLLADEPTTALDVVVQRELLQELRETIRKLNMSMLLVTHDLHLAHDIADKVSVMYAGYLLEEGPVAKVLPNPSHPYTEGLLDAMPDMTSVKGTLKPIPGEIPPPDKLGSGCPFASRCGKVCDSCRQTLTALTEIDASVHWRSRCTKAHDAPVNEQQEGLQQVTDMMKSIVNMEQTDFPTLVNAQIKRHCYYTRQGLLGRKKPWDVLQDIDVQIEHGEILGLVGESGCGKSTLARLLLGHQKPTQGIVLFKDQPIPEPRSKPWRAQRAAMQMIYQDPYGCFDARMPIIEQVAEPLLVHKHLSKESALERAAAVLKAVGMPAHHMNKLPVVMSGGQLQRAAIARAVALEPALLVCDEPVASLDVSIQAQVLELLYNLRNASHMSMLFVSHNLNVVRYICDRVVVMYLGRIVESGDVDEIFKHPKHPYTQLLMASTPGADASVIRFYPKGSMPSPIDRPKGCVFANRCPVATTRCHLEVPALTKLSDNHACACFEQKVFEALQASEGEA
ncbi:dipeptide ABC transporter ATP-binding protein [Parasutterella secunda]|uniref:dipeptide ABC transporter ATP-binding protein n=1 Tax=Parasutterella secunda TaxID=626947 RepID=UPI0025A4867E|nr:ABC transporter ATP-binding protein [Parasutterella secunda]MDM8218723.1 ABC transporter ATP-binding protein [Parasutterella secunda]